MPNEQSVIVCGGGIIGLCTAYYLARQGFRVTVVERDEAQAGSCADGSAGYVSPSHVAPISAPGLVWQGLKWMTSSRSPFYIKPRLSLDLVRWGRLFAQSCTPEHTRRAAPVLAQLCLASRELYVDLANQTKNAIELQTQGLLNLCKTDEALQHEAEGLAKLASQCGIESRVLDAADTAKLEPLVRMAVGGSVYFPQDAHLTPTKLVGTLLRLLADLGVTVRWGITVKGWTTAGESVSSVLTTAGELKADEYVVATGSWASENVRDLGIRLPMQPGKGYSLTINRPRFHFTKSLILTERRVAVTPMGNTLRFGGTMELSGHSDAIRPERVEQIKDAALAYFPEFTPADFAGVAPWFGYRPVSPDGLPYIGRFAKYNNLTAACGHAMLGVTLAPITGVLVAETLLSRTPTIDLTLVKPDRFR